MLETLFIFKFLKTMFFMILTDIAWTVYFIKVEERKVISSGIWSALIMLCSIFVVTSYVDDRRLMLAAVIGAFIGTAGTVYWKKRKEKNGK